jgi:hypothetical protein
MLRNGHSLWLFASLLLLAIAPGAATAGPAEAAASAQAATPTAQALLFDAEYLLSLRAPSRLIYHYTQRTADEELFGPGYEDEIAMRLTASQAASDADGKAGNSKKDVTVTLFSGERAREIGPITRVSGNPILMVFLERDIQQMSRHVGGQPVYFRNVIRAAFRDKARIEPVEITWEGRPAHAMRVTIEPFKDDPNGQRMQLFRTKRYQFTVSDAVPGGIYRIETTIGDERLDPNQPAMDVGMTLTRIDYDVR